MRRGSQVKSLTLTRLSAIIRAIQNLNQVKYMKKQLRLSSFVFAGLLAVSAFNSSAALYNGNGVVDPDGAVGNGSLELSISSGSLSVNFHPGVSPIQDNLVLFIDSIPDSGYSGTASFNAYGGINTVISGYNGMGRSTAVFAPGLYADYAIVLTRANFGLYALGTDSFDPKQTGSVYYSGNSYSGSIGLDLMGLSETTTYFKFQSSDVGDFGARRLESFERLNGTSGFGTITFANYNEFGTPPVPEPVNVALGVFGLLACGGGIISGWRRRRTKR